MPPKNSKHLLCISYFKFKYEHKNKIAMILLFSLPLHAQIKKPIHTYNSDLLTDHNKNMPIYNKYKKNIAKRMVVFNLYLHDI